MQKMFAQGPPGQPEQAEEEPFSRTTLLVIAPRTGQVTVAATVTL